MAGLLVKEALFFVDDLQALGGIHLEAALFQHVGVSLEGFILALGKYALAFQSVEKSGCLFPALIPLIVQFHSDGEFLAVKDVDGSLPSLQALPGRAAFCECRRLL